MFGFWNKILRVDLSSGASREESVSDEVLRIGLGGKGLGSYLLLKEVPPKVNPLSPENKLIFACGPATATSLPGCSRYGVYSKAPLTGAYSETYSGGFLAPQMKGTGYDALVIEGAAKSPVYLHVSESGASLHSADDLWGRDTYETEEALVARVGKRGAQACVIGPAGENLVRFACIENNKWHSAGRTGLGAVMGSKKLKGIVFNGEKKCPVADESYLKELADELTRHGNRNKVVAANRKYGTTQMVAVYNLTGSFPTRYWSAGTLEGWERIGGDYLLEHFAVEPRSCKRCFVACVNKTTVKEGRHAGLTVEGPEYETISAFGGLCLIMDLAEIVYLNDLCDRLGMDTISAGNMVALVMEAAHRGVLEAPDYGDAEGAAELLRMIAFRKGIGDLLAQGIVPTSKQLSLEGIAIHVKGMEPAGIDPRVFKGMGLAYAVTSRGACHLRSTFYKKEMAGIIAPEAIEGKAEMLVDMENRLALFDSLILCRLYRDLVEWEHLLSFIEAITGLRMSYEEASQMANRIMTLTRLFNHRAGFTKADDVLPPRFHDEAIDGHIITREELDKLLSDYYRARGWDDRGVPPDLNYLR